MTQGETAQAETVFGTFSETAESTPEAQSAQQSAQPEPQTHTPPTKAHSDGGTYTATVLAEEFGVKPPTIRTRWYPWINKVAPEPLLKKGKSYTELARTLFADLSKFDGSDRAQWVKGAKQRYSAEWESVGVIEGELMPEEVGGMLALVNQQQESLASSNQSAMADVDAFIDAYKTAEANISKGRKNKLDEEAAAEAIAEFKHKHTRKLQIKAALEARLEE